MKWENWTGVTYVIRCLFCSRILMLQISLSFQTTILSLSVWDVLLSCQIFSLVELNLLPFIVPVILPSQISSFLHYFWLEESPSSVTIFGNHWYMHKPKSWRRVWYNFTSIWFHVPTSKVDAFWVFFATESFNKLQLCCSCLNMPSFEDIKSTKHKRK